MIIGQDTDSESNLLSAGMPWIVKLRQGRLRRALRRGAACRSGGCASGSSDSRCRGRGAGRGSAGRRRGRPAGRVTSARASERVGKTVGLAWVSPEQAEEGAEITIRVGRADERATVTLDPFYDLAGERLRA